MLTMPLSLKASTSGKALGFDKKGDFKAESIFDDETHLFRRQNVLTKAGFDFLMLRNVDNMSVIERIHFRAIVRHIVLKKWSES